MSLIVTDKMLDCIDLALRPSTWIMAFEGSIRSIKTTTEIQLLHFLVYKSLGKYSLIACNDMSFINDVILQSEVGLISLYPNYYRLKKDLIGGYYVEADYNDGREPKHILLCGFNNATRWKAINGHAFDVICCDEANTANQQFIREALARQASIDHPKFIMTMNGDSPTCFIYQEVVNYCQPLGKVPASILSEMAKFEKKPKHYYVHFTMEDNPIMTPDKIARAKATYPVGSYYYKIKILGERGTAGSLIFNEYMSEDLFTTSTNYNYFTVGVDIGATQAENSVTLTGWKSNMEEVCFIENYSFKQVGYKEKSQMILNKVLEWKAKYGYIEVVSVDSAEQNYIYDLKKLFSTYNLQVIPSYKATIKERIDLLIILMSLKRLKFHTRTKPLYDAYLMAKWEEGKEGERREDLNNAINDKMDSAEYSLTVHMKQLLLEVKRSGIK